MASQHPDIEQRQSRESNGCVITPMSNGDNGVKVQLVHLIDALIVACIVFFSLLLGEAFTAILVGGSAYIGLEEMVRRLPTAAIAFGLTFFAQWARYRGIQIVSILGGK